MIDITQKKEPSEGRSLKDIRLSYSSQTTLSNCEQKYYYYKVQGLEKDPDFEDSFEAFNYGKAFHYINEKTLHDFPKSKSEFEILLVFCQTKFDLDNESKLKLKACLLVYWAMASKSGLKPVENGIEIEASNKDYIGYLDAVMSEDDGSWWIVDLKTAGMLDKGTIAQLGQDMQLNLYSYFVPLLAEKLKLDVTKFKGCRYRVTLKSRAAYGKKDTDETFVKRVMASIKTYDFIVDKSELDPEYFYAEFLENHKLSKKLRDSKKAPKKNFKACFNYFRPCEYWSNCHKKETYTQALARMRLLD